VICHFNNKRGRLIPPSLILHEMKQKQKANYVNINLSFMNNSLSIKEATVLSYIVSLSDNKGYCFASNLSISNALSINDRTLYRILNKLEESNYINRVTKSLGNFGKERRIYVAPELRNQPLM
jgi:DNA-binding MarR family transcriptional regulator